MMSVIFVAIVAIQMATMLPMAIAIVDNGDAIFDNGDKGPAIITIFDNIFRQSQVTSCENSDLVCDFCPNLEPFAH